MTIYTVTLGRRAGEPVTTPVDWARLPDAAKEKIIAYGVQRTFNDMVGGKKFPTIESKSAHVTEAIARYYAGDIGRAAVAGVSIEQAIGRQLVRAALKAKHGAKSPAWAKFTGLSDAEQEAKLDELLEKNREAFADDIATEMKRRAELAAKRAKQAAKMDLDF